VIYRANRNSAHFIQDGCSCKQRSSSSGCLHGRSVVTQKSGSTDWCHMFNLKFEQDSQGLERTGQVKPVIRLETFQTEQMADVLSRALHEESHFAYVLPDEKARRAVLPWFLRAVIRASHLRRKLHDVRPCRRRSLVWSESHFQHSANGAKGTAVDALQVRDDKLEALAKAGRASRRSPSTSRQNAPLVSHRFGSGAITAANGHLRSLDATCTVASGLRGPPLLPGNLPGTEPFVL
jgi:hypothetical protein